MRIKKIVFMGTPEFAVPSLEKLVSTKYKPVLCCTQPDRAKGRSLKVQPTPVKLAAKAHNIPIIQADDINDQKNITEIEQIQPDIIITVAYGGYLQRRIRRIPLSGCLNLHPSLLPKYRGPSPINYALFNGETETGCTIFRLNAKMDAGPILYRSYLPIRMEDNLTSLTMKLAQKGADDLIMALDLLESENYSYSEQNESLASYTALIRKEDTVINWNRKAEEINNFIRGLSEKPGAYTLSRNRPLKIIEAEVLEDISEQMPGTVVRIIKNTGIVVSTLDFDLLLSKVQPAGKMIMNAFSYNLGARLNTGEQFG